MSLKRSHSGGKSSFGGSGGDAGAKVDRQELFDELKRLAGATIPSRRSTSRCRSAPASRRCRSACSGLAAEGYLEKVEVGRYRATLMADMGQAEFLKAFARASKVDSTRQRDLSEIGRLKQNNDTMRQRLLAAIAERDHYLAVLKTHGIDPGPPPAPPAPVAVVVERRGGARTGRSGGSVARVGAAAVGAGRRGWHVASRRRRRRRRPNPATDRTRGRCASP